MARLAAALLVVVAGCGSAPRPPDASAPDAGTDAPAVTDAPVDAPVAVDAPTDAAEPDAPVVLDASLDGGACVDPAPGTDRPVAGACSACRPVGPEPGAGLGPCASHADCTAGDNGRCVLGMIGTFCSYDACFTDADCATGEVCSCDGDLLSDANVCVPADCETNADCATGICAPSYGCLEGAGPESWHCRTPTDECTDDGVCDASPGGRCAFDAATGHWACAYGICVL